MKSWQRRRGWVCSNLIVSVRAENWLGWGLCRPRRGGSTRQRHREKDHNSDQKMFTELVPVLALFRNLPFLIQLRWKFKNWICAVNSLYPTCNYQIRLLPYLLWNEILLWTLRMKTTYWSSVCEGNWKRWWSHNNSDDISNKNNLYD